MAAHAQDLSTPAIAGVVNAGTPVHLLKDGYESVEGPLPQADGGVLFSNNRVHHIERIGPDGVASTWWEGAGGANGLSMTSKGEVVATLAESHAIGVVKPGETARILVDAYQGTPFNRPNDLVASRRGDIYFTDTVPLDRHGTCARSSRRSMPGRRRASWCASRRKSPDRTALR